MKNQPSSHRHATAVRAFALLAAWFLVVNLVAAGASNVRSGQQDDEPLRVSADLVLTTVTVTDANGRFVPGLTADDFILLEDGVQQKIDHFSAEDTPFSATILIDSSGSMRTRIRQARVAAARFQDLIRSTDTVAVYSFNTAVERVQDFSSDRDISSRVFTIEARGQTRLYDCLNTAIEALDGRTERRRAVVVISDGADTDSQTNFKTVLKHALQADVLVYAVDLIDPSFPNRSPEDVRSSLSLQELAEKSGGRYIKSSGGQQLDKAFESVVQELRQQYTLGFYPTKGYTVGQYHKLEVKIRRPGLKWRSRQGYY
jgi:Ca-activated chloride channel homolog